MQLSRSKALLASAAVIVSPVAFTSPAGADASGCTGRNGPGQVNTSCVDLIGSGLYVERVKAHMGTGPDYHYLCLDNAAVWGTLENGQKYDVQVRPQCGHNAAWAYVHPRQNFKAYTDVCAATQWEGHWSRPACVTIKP
ncbi:MAG: hypothetical protein ACRDY7_10165 [Acidimicrobiia bacterium]